jgi:hypothetical protein
MELPLETQQLCEKYLAKVRQDPEHQLERPERYRLYESFQPGSFDFPDYTRTGAQFVQEEYNQFLEDNFHKTNLGDIVVGWLGILTVKYALAEWDLVTNLYDSEKYFLKEVKEILRICQKALIERRDYEEYLESLYNYYPFEIQNNDEIDKNLASLHDAAIIALEVILYDCKDYEMVESALEAYTVIDLNIEGEGNLEEPPVPLEYDLNKRLEFWEWWLTEAIPQAWELANKTFSAGK